VHLVGVKQYLYSKMHGEIRIKINGLCTFYFMIQCEGSLNYNVKFVCYSLDFISYVP
jgi:hypothetical protein